jgi:hypothetical protein
MDMADMFVHQQVAVGIARRGNTASKAERLRGDTPKFAGRWRQRNRLMTRAMMLA